MFGDLVYRLIHIIYLHLENKFSCFPSCNVGRGFWSWKALRRSRKGSANFKLFVIIPFPIYLNENSSWFTQKRRKWSNFGGRKWMEDTFLCLIVEMNTITLVYPDARIFAPPAISLLLLSDGAISLLTSPYQPGISRKHPFHTPTTPVRFAENIIIIWNN